MLRKYSKLLAILATLALLIAACGGGGPAEEPADEEPMDEEPMDEEPMDEEPADEEPADEEPMDEEPMEWMAMDAVAAPSCDYGGFISSIEAVDQHTVKFTLCKSDPAFAAKVAFTPFGIQPSEWIAETGGTGEILQHPIGTGAYMLDEWAVGESVTFKRFDDYWGEPAIAETLVFRWSTEGAARLLELQTGNVHQITNVSPDDFEVVEADPNLVLLPEGNPNVLYLAMTNTFAPFDDVRVRQAIAMGIDRQRIVDNFYPAGSTVADYFTPCSIANACEGDPWYDFDPEAAKALLAEAGYEDGFETAIYFRNVFRGYLPEPSLVAVEFQTQLAENLGITAEVVEMESGEFIQASTQGQLEGFYLLGWGADYPHVTNFLDYHFGTGTVQFGDTFPEIVDPLLAASTIADVATAAPLYAEANNAIRELVPMVPIAHGEAAGAALVSLTGGHERPFGAPVFSTMDPGGDTLVFMQNAEPISLYCADESDGESLSACQQVVEPLFHYAIDSGDTIPALATSCDANEDATEFTCHLRQGVKFHDGSDFDANDVLASWDAGINAASEYHTGNSGAFDYYAYLWAGFINAEE